MYSPKYTITNKILNNIGAIEAAKEVIENAPLVPSFEKQFKTDAIVRIVHHGTHIEGNDLTLSQAKQVMEGQEIVGRDRDIQEVINYRNVILLLEELREKRGGYSVDMLIDIYRETVKDIVSKEKLGVRKTQVVIKEEGTGKVIFEPPAFVEVTYLLDDFFKWLNSEESREIHPILRAGVCHYTLVTIHPFVEGNGRSIRAFATLFLMREKYDIKRFFALEEHFDNDLASYYEAFKEVDSKHKDIAKRDLTSWLEYFTKVVAIELTKVKEKVRKISIDSRLRLKVGKQVALTERQMKLIEYLSEHTSVVMRDLREVFSMISEDTILRDIKDLMKKGIIVKEGSTKGARYIITQGKG
jgi:Fic family protein